MTLRAYLVILSLTSAVSWGTFLYIAWMVNPETTNSVGFFLFYLTLFFSLMGATTLMGFVVRFIALKRTLAFRAVAEAFRQSFLFSIFIIATLLLLSQGYFNWLNVGLLIVGLSVLEFFLISYKK